MSKVSLEQITSQAHSNFHQLFKKSWSVVQKYQKTYGKDDIRCDFFVVFSELNAWLLIQFDVFAEILKPANDEIGKYYALTPNDRIQFLLQYDTINRSSFTLKSMFDVEDFLHSIDSALGWNNTGGFYKFTGRFLTQLGITDPQKFKILNAPAQIRNSLHNHGVASEDFDLTLRGNTYSFRSGQTINFTGWNNLDIFFDELFDVLIEIIENQNVKQITKIPHHSEFTQHV